MILTLRPDEAWLKDEKRVYPVIIDPVVTTSLNSADINDVHVSKGSPSTNYIYSTILKTGWGTSSDVNRIYFRFLNLPSLSSADMVTDAVFTLTQKTSHTSAARQLNLVEVLTTWVNSTLTWNNQPLGTAVPVSNNVEDYAMIQGSSGTSHQWNITRLVQQWYNSGVNHGFMLEDHAPGTTSASYNEYYSSEASASRPMVIISYRNTSGLEPYWTYRSQSIGRAGTVYTQDVTGNLVLVHSDASLSGNRMPIAIRHVYNSNDLSNMGYGKGFRLNIHQEVSTVVVGSITYYRYIDGDGTSHYFPKVGSSPYEDEDGLGYHLVENTASTTARYVITDKDDNKMEFNSANDLVKIIDRNDNTMTITYASGKVASVADGSGRTMTLTYSGNLQKITDVAGRHIQYSYDASGNLTQITYPDNLASIYAYSGSLLTSVKNHDGYELVVGYSTSSPKRVVSLTEKNGATLGTTLSMTYGDNFTTFTDFSNRSLQLQFTDWGHTVAKVNDLGYAQYFKFFDGDGGAAANKLNSVSKLQQSITNTLFNSGGESGDTGWSDVHGSGSTATVDITTADKFLGNYSLRVIKTNTTSFSQHSQTLTLTKGQTYTLSSRIKTVSVSSANQGGAWLEASYKNSSGTYVTVNCSPLRGSQDWTKQSITFTIPSDATDGTVLIRLGIKNETGTAYFDNVQVEEGDVANRYNLLSNSGFTSGLTGWTHSGGSIVTLQSRLNVSTQALQIGGSASLDRYVSQDVNVGGSSGDVYTFGGWAKADSVPTNTTKIFDVTVEFYNGTTLVNRVSADFNPSFKNWQYVSGAAIASGSYTKVRLLARYHKNLNTVAFDDLALFKETFSTSYQYDANGNVISTQQLSNETNGMQYNANDDLIKLTDEIGGEYNYTYDNKHNLLSALSANDVKYTMTYDAYGNNTSLTTNVNLIAYYSFDGNNLNDSSGNGYHGTNFGATFAPGKSGNAIVFNGTSQWAQLTDFPVGDNFSISMWVKPHSTLDGQLILGKHDSSGNNIWLYGYWENGIHTRIRSLTTTDGTKYSNEYKHHLLTFEKMSATSTRVSVIINGLLVYRTTLNQTIQPTAGKPWVLGQDWDGSVISEYFDGEIDELAFFSGIIDPSKIISTSATTEANGQYTDKVTDALGNVTDTNWDANKGLLTSSKDANGFTTTYTYHTNNDKLTAVSSGGAIVDYGYTGDQLSSITRNNFSYGFTFDSLGNPTSVKMGTSPLITHSYQGRTSRLSSSLYANGGKVEYIYDTLDRVIGVKIDNADSPQFEYRYDASGNLAIVKDNLRNITTYLEYDLANRLSKITDSQGHATTYGFDAKNRLSGVSEVLKGTTYTSSYTYNADNQPATVSADGKTHSYTYDLLGRLSGTSLNTTTPYTTALTYKTNPSTGSSSHVLDSYRSGSTTTTYQVDANGNITELSDGTDTATYVYDDFNQLKRENNQWLNKSITYDYDLGGNLLAVKEYAYTTGTLGSPTSTVVYTYDDTWKDQLTNIGGYGLTYDTNGNLLSYKTRSYSWQAGRQLAQITDTNLNAVYTYNESGIRTRKEVNEVITDYVLEGGKVILETTGNDTLHYSYDSRGQLVAFKLNGTPYFYTRNGQGDITGLIDASGVEVVRYTYDSWGKPVSITGSLALTVGTKNPYRYRGYRYDHESGLYYLQSRYYDPSIKRFISADDMDILELHYIHLNQFNLFAYCHNNPMNNHDPDGYFAMALASGGFLATGLTIGGANFWNPVGLVMLGIVTIGAVTAAGIWLYNKNQASKPKSPNLPAYKKLSLDMDHIMSGHYPGGGRNPKGKKSVFYGMTVDAVRRAIEEAYKVCEKIQTQGNNVLVRGYSETYNMVIEMWVNIKDRIIETAYPK